MSSTIKTDDFNASRPLATVPETDVQIGDTENQILAKLLKVAKLQLAESGGGATLTTPTYTEVSAAGATATITAGKKSVAINPESGGTYQVSVGGVAMVDRSAATKTFTTGMTINAELGTTLPEIIITRVAGVTQILSTSAA